MISCAWVRVKTFHTLSFRSQKLIVMFPVCLNPDRPHSIIMITSTGPRPEYHPRAHHYGKICSTTPYNTIRYVRTAFDTSSSILRTYINVAQSWRVPVQRIAPGFLIPRPVQIIATVHYLFAIPSGYGCPTSIRRLRMDTPRTTSNSSDWQS